MASSSGSSADKKRKKRLARMRAYYRNNKEKWKAYKRASLATVSEVEQEERRQKNREYSRHHYVKHRKKIIARTKRYRAADPAKWEAYRAAWYQQNKPAVAARRRRHYHAVVKPRINAAKATSPFMTVRQAVELLGANLSAFRRWVYEGRLPAVRTPGGRYLLRRELVEAIGVNRHHLPKEHQQHLGLYRKGGAR